MSERLTPDQKLGHRAEFQHCYRNGERRHGAFVTLFWAPNSLGYARIGITATRKVGSAVERNLLKRRVREIYRRWSGRAELPALDLVVHLKPSAGTASFAELERDLRNLWRHLGTS